jgi:hypothetical protein
MEQKPATAVLEIGDERNARAVFGQNLDLRAVHSVPARTIEKTDAEVVAADGADEPGECPRRATVSM